MIELFNYGQLGISHLLNLAVILMGTGEYLLNIYMTYKPSNCQILSYILFVKKYKIMIISNLVYSLLWIRNIFINFGKYSRFYIPLILFTLFFISFIIIIHLSIYFSFFWRNLSPPLMKIEDHLQNYQEPSTISKVKNTTTPVSAIS